VKSDPNADLAFILLTGKEMSDADEIFAEQFKQRGKQRGNQLGFIQADEVLALGSLF